MDWTGGTKRRYAGAKSVNAALQRQKAHFARARAAMNQTTATDHGPHPPSSAFRIASSRAGRRDSQPFESHSRDPTHASLLRLHPSKHFNAHNDDARTGLKRGSGRIGGSTGDISARNSQNPGSKSESPVSHTIAHTDHELLLISNRCKLLAQKDWLSLRPTKPLRFDFRATADGERVGRRKKIKRSSGMKKAKLPEPFKYFDDRNHLQFVMSGAIPDRQVEEIKIRVGTSAFESQWSHSRQSQWSKDLNDVDAIRQSRSLSHLSEESMLLEADGDTFDADQVQVPVTGTGWLDQEAVPADQSVVAAQGSQTVTLDRDEYIKIKNHSDDVYPEYDEPDIGVQDDDILFGSMQTTLDNLADVSSAKRASNRTFDDAHNAPAGEQIALRSGLIGQETSERAAELEWKKLFGIPTQTQSLMSNEAVVSSSRHLTASEAILSPDGNNLRVSATAENAIRPPPDNADEGSRQALKWHQSRRYVDSHWACNSAANQGKVDLPQKEDQHNDDGEALWREFIIGSQDDHSEDETHLAWQRSRKRKQQSSEMNDCLQLSGLGTSDQATQGDTKATGSSASSAACSPINDSARGEARILYMNFGRRKQI